MQEHEPLYICFTPNSKLWLRLCVDGMVFSNKAVFAALSEAYCFDCVLHFYNFIVTHYSPTSCSSVLQVFSDFEQQMISVPQWVIEHCCRC